MSDIGVEVELYSRASMHLLCAMQGTTTKLIVYKFRQPSDLFYSNQKVSYHVSLELESCMCHSLVFYQF
jgi:hypothetical protein